MVRNEKNEPCDFLSDSRNFDAISCKKMREYREITPENDPCACVRQHFQTTSSEAAEPILLKFHMEPPYVGGTKDC